MAKRKSTIRRLTVNKYGNPILSIRTALKTPVVLDGDEYTEAHVYATLSTFVITLRNTKRSHVHEYACLWENWDKYSCPSTSYGMEIKIKEFLEDLSAGKAPKGMDFRSVTAGTVLI